MSTNLSSLPAKEFTLLSAELDLHTGLSQVIAWGTAKPKEYVRPQIVTEVITQDEFTHDVVVPYRNVFLVYDTT